jgi:hypothetical protein
MAPNILFISLLIELADAMVEVAGDVEITTASPTAMESPARLKSLGILKVAFMIVTPFS